MEFNLGQVIASRKLDYAGQEVNVQIGLPVQFSDESRDYYCPFRVDGLGQAGTWESFAGGVDSIQALIFALAAIGDRLSHDARDLTYLGGAELGFPVTQKTAESMWVAIVQYPTMLDEATA